MRLIYTALLNSEGSMGDRTAYGESDNVDTSGMHFSEPNFFLLFPLVLEIGYFCIQYILIIV